MTTLSVMKSRISSELRRSNIDTQIASAIDSAIASYQHERWWFNESTEILFSTVAAQWAYGADDDADLGNLQRIDYVQATVSDNTYPIYSMSPAEIDRKNTDADTDGQPLGYAYYEDKIWFYPIPDAAYSIRIGGVIARAAPASDAETGNVWMIEAEKLIRCRAKWELYQHVLMDQVKAAQFNPDNDSGPTAIAHRELMKKSNWLINEGGSFCVEPTCF